MPGRTELPYRLTPRTPSNDNPPILLPGSRNADLNLEPPYCIAFTTTLPTTGGLLFAAMDPAFVGSIVTTLRISSTSIVLESGGETAIFDPPGGATSFVQTSSEYIHLQICVTENVAELYINCSGQPQTRNFVTNQRLDTALITFFQNETSNPGDVFTVRVASIMFMLHPSTVVRDWQGFI